MMRRDFLKGTAAVAGMLHFRHVAGATFAHGASAPRLRIGILSDTHLDGGAAAAQKLERALRFFREARVDGVLVCGDIAHNGLVPQLEEFAAAWQMVFPGDCGLDGMHVEKLFHYGDHDTGGKCHFRGGRHGGKADGALQVHEGRA